jgi:hypothetical protein
VLEQLVPFLLDWVTHFEMPAAPSPPPANPPKESLMKTNYVPQSEVIRTIADRFGVARSTAGRLLKKLGLRPRVSLSRKTVRFDRQDVDRMFREIETT